MSRKPTRGIPFPKGILDDQIAKDMCYFMFPMDPLHLKLPSAFGMQTMEVGPTFVGDQVNETTKRLSIFSVAKHTLKFHHLADFFLGLLVCCSSAFYSFTKKWFKGKNGSQSGLFPRLSSLLFFWFFIRSWKSDSREKMKFSTFSHDFEMGEQVTSRSDAAGEMVGSLVEAVDNYVETREVGLRWRL